MLTLTRRAGQWLRIGLNRVAILETSPDRVLVQVGQADLCGLMIEGGRGLELTFPGGSSVRVMRHGVGKVVLSVAAPASVEVVRGELLERRVA